MKTRSIQITIEDRNWELNELKDFEQALLWRTVEIAREAKKYGMEPFGALLADQDGNILLEQGNDQNGEIVDCTAHAETQLMRRASLIYTKEQMRTFTLYTCAEPCCMCFGAMYWGYLGRLIYGARESDLMGNDTKNPTLDLPCRAVAARGQQNIEILGPFPGINEQYLSLFD